MRDFAGGDSSRPFGYFVHHQGRGHAERCAAVANALPPERPVTVFCARGDMFPPLRPGVEVQVIPSLFERTGMEAGSFDHVATPDTLHCAPLGWPGIRQAMATIAAWFESADPALMICDVSAEIAQLSRICSVPHVKILQHGDRTDPGHRAAYDGAVGLLAPFHAALAQPDWTPEMLAKTHFAPGLGIRTAMPDREEARRRLGLDNAATVALVLSGDGGGGMSQAPLGVAARAFPGILWRCAGRAEGDWHATVGANLRLLGWVNNIEDEIAAADFVVSSAGNTACQQILAARKPWIVVPEWRYFDEQVAKAAALALAGAAHALPAPPSSAHRWRDAMAAAIAGHDPDRQASLVGADPDLGAARWLEGLAGRLWPAAPVFPPNADHAR